MATTEAKTKKKKEISLTDIRNKALSYITVSPDASMYKRAKNYQEFSWNDENIEDKIIEALPSPESVAFCSSFIKNGVTLHRIYCPLCGEVTEVSSYYYRQRWSCPSCLGKVASVLYATLGCTSDGAPHSVMVALEVDLESGTAILMNFSYWAEYTVEDADVPFKELAKSLESNYTFSFGSPVFYVFHKKYGLKKVTSKGLSKNDLNPIHYGTFLNAFDYNKMIELLQSVGIRVKDGEICGSNIEELAEIETASSRASALRKAAKELAMNAEDELYVSCDYEDVKRIIFEHHKGFPYAAVYNDDVDGKTALYACSSCGKVGIAEVTKGTGGEVVVCPDCGEVISVQSYYSFGMSDWFVDWSIASDGSLVATKYNYQSHLDVSSADLHKSVVPSARIVYKTNNFIRYYYNSDEKKFKRNDKIKSDFYIRTYGDNKLSNADKYTINSYRGKDNLKEVIESSVLAKSGFIEALGLDDSSNLFPIADTQFTNAYLATYYDAPIVELLVKCNMDKLAKDILSQWVNTKKVDIDNVKATTIQEAFGLNKTLFKLARTNDLNMAQIRSLKRHYECDPTMDYEDFDWSITTFGINSECINIMQKSGCKLKRVREYITSCYYNQCIAYTESCRLWLDYLTMMERLKFSPKEFKKEMFPRSLKKAHDVLNFAARAIETDVNAEKFKETVEGAKKYRYTFGDYMLTTPESAEDIIKEGIDLNHSVAQHIELVVDKREYICFIRKKSAPDESFYTVELVGDSIVQVRGNSNRPVIEEDVRTFIKKWAKFKKLKIQSL